MKLEKALIVMLVSTCNCEAEPEAIQYLGSYSPFLAAPLSPYSPYSPYSFPGSSGFFQQFPGLASFPTYRGHYSLPWAQQAPVLVNQVHPAPVLLQEAAPAPVIVHKTTAPLHVHKAPLEVAAFDAVDVGAEDTSAVAPLVTVAQEIDAIPSPPKSPFRGVPANIPAGIGAQSTQPKFVQTAFKNSKFSPLGLFLHNSKVSPILREIQQASAGKPSIVETF